MSVPERGSPAWLDAVTNRNFTVRLLKKMAQQSDFVAATVPPALQAERDSHRMFTHEQLVEDTTKVPCRLPTNN